MTRHGALWIGLALVAGGCETNWNEPVAALAERVAKLEGANGVSGPVLAGEIEQRAKGDAETLAAAKSYSDVKAAEVGMASSRAVDAEAQARMKAVAEGDAATLEAAKKYADGVRPFLVEPRLYARDLNGGPRIDLGKSWFDAFAAATIGGKRVQIYRSADSWVYFDTGGCQGKALLSNPPSQLGNVRYIAGGKLYRPAGRFQKATGVSRMDGVGKCEQVGLGGDFVPAEATGETAQAYEPGDLFVEDAPVIP